MFIHAQKTSMQIRRRRKRRCDASISIGFLPLNTRRVDSWRRIYIDRVVAQSCNLSPPSLLLCPLCLLALVHPNTICPFHINHLLLSLWPTPFLNCSVSATLPEVRVDGKAVVRIAQSTNTPLVEKEKRKQQKDHRYAMHVRQGCINFELGSQQCFSQCCQGVREWFPCSHALFVLGLPSFSCKRWSAVLYSSSIYYPCSNIRTYGVLFPDTNKDSLIEGSFVYDVRLHTVLSFLALCKNSISFDGT